MGLWIFGHGNNGTAHWEPDPADARGTWSILSTCIITLALCVYTSLHLNILAPKSSLTTICLMKAKYVVFGLLAPELIVFNAWRQRTVASSLVVRLRKDRGGKHPPHTIQRLRSMFRKLCESISRLWKRSTGKPVKAEVEIGLPFAATNDDPWAKLTLVHAFYIVMGGYTFDVSKDTRPGIWPRNVDRLTPNVMAVLGCLTSQDKDLREVVPFVSEEEIWDKSKANGLAKSIVCIQAAWFCAQCIARIAQGMPVSLLELNTFAHAVCALLVYILWWSKPLDVQEPTVVDIGQSDTARNICAFAWSGPQAPVPHMRRVSPMDNRLWKRLLDQIGLFLKGSAHFHLGDGPLTLSGSSQGSQRSRVHYAQNVELRRPLVLGERPRTFEGLDTQQMDSRIWSSWDPPVFALKGGAPIPSTALEVSNSWSWIDLDEILLERLRVVEKLRSLPNFSAFEAAFSRILDTTDPDLCMLKPRELNFTDSLMRQDYGVASVGRNLTGTSGIIVSGFLYGGLHMIAWGSTAFTSRLEDIAWKVSCFVVAGGGLFASVGIFGLDIATKREEADRRMDVVKGMMYVMAPLYMFFTLLYLVCRVYLVFEVFRNLAYLDPRVYQTPDVSPHPSATSHYLALRVIAQRLDVHGFSMANFQHAVGRVLSSYLLKLDLKYIEDPAGYKNIALAWKSRFDGKDLRTRLKPEEPDTVSQRRMSDFPKGRVK